MFGRKKFFLFLIIFSLIFNLIAVNKSLAFEVSSPVILEIIQEEDGEEINPVVVGLVKGDVSVLIYLDGEYTGDAEINNEGTGIDNFYFEIKEKLDFGRHTIKAIAKDSTTLVLSPVSEEVEFYINPLPAPTLVEPNEKTVTGKVKHLIRGLTKSNSLVHVFIDGVYNGKTETLVHESGTANFAYKPFLNLSVGDHLVWVVAEDEQGRMSGRSNNLNFKIEKPLPAPVLLSPVTNKNTTYQKPFIVGLAKNDLDVKVFIDHKFYGQFKVENYESGTANFAYKPFASLENGRHIVYAVAVDSRGKESMWSNIIYFNVGAPVIPSITPVAAEEKIKEVDEIIIVEGIEAEESDINMQAVDSTEKEIVDDKDIKDLLSEEGEKETEKTGAINESKEQQGKLKLNLVVFILFLFAVIGWIFWVNRELIKERKNENKEKDSNKNKKASKLDI